MAIFLTENSKVVVQGMTGSEGQKHTRRMLASGTQVVGGVNPRKAGESVDFDGTAVPVFGSVKESMDATGADVSVVFVPPAFTKAAVIEAVDAGMPLVVVITEGVPVHDTAEFFSYAQAKGTTRVIGPNCLGVMSPFTGLNATFATTIARPGSVGFIHLPALLVRQATEAPFARELHGAPGRQVKRQLRERQRIIRARKAWNQLALNQSANEDRQGRRPRPRPVQLDAAMLSQVVSRGRGSILNSCFPTAATSTLSGS